MKENTMMLMPEVGYYLFISSNELRLYFRFNREKYRTIYKTIAKQIRLIEGITRVQEGHDKYTMEISHGEMFSFEEFKPQIILILSKYLPVEWTPIKGRRNGSRR